MPRGGKHADACSGQQERNDSHDNGDQWYPPVDAADGRQVLLVAVALERLQLGNLLMGVLKIEVIGGHGPPNPCNEVDVRDAHGNEAKACPKVHFTIQKPPKGNEKRRPTPACVECHRDDRKLLKFLDENVGIFPDETDIVLG